MSEGTPAELIEYLVDMIDELGWWAWTGIPAVVMVALQGVFLLPVLSRRPPKGERSHSLVVSLVIGAMFAALLTAGLATAVIDLVAVLTSPEGSGAHPFGFGNLVYPDYAPMIVLVILVGGWGFWSLVLLLFVRGTWSDRTLGRLIGVLLGGTLLEVIVVLPLTVIVRRRESCYCATGTFYTLVIAAFVVLWLAGPGIVIALTSKRHRLWRERHCENCGYAKGPSPDAMSAKCSECGHGWMDVGGRGRPVGKGD